MSLALWNTLTRRATEATELTDLDSHLVGPTAIAFGADSICQSRNYSTNKNNQNETKRLEIKKFCKTCNEHTLHRETK